MVSRLLYSVCFQCSSQNDIKRHNDWRKYLFWENIFPYNPLQAKKQFTLYKLLLKTPSTTLFTNPYLQLYILQTIFTQLNTKLPGLPASKWKYMIYIYLEIQNIVWKSFCPSPPLSFFFFSLSLLFLKTGAWTSARNRNKDKLKLFIVCHGLSGQ